MVLFASEDSEHTSTRVGKGAKGRPGERDTRDRMQLTTDLDALHLQACQEVSAETRAKIVALEARLAALTTGPASFPQNITFIDLLPQWTSAEERAVALEEECSIIEALNAKRVLIKDAFRSYASSALTEITALDKISLGEIRTFVKDMRCSTRVSLKLPQLFYSTLHSHTMFADGRASRGAEEDSGAVDDDDELGLAKFVEILVRISKEQIAGKDQIARKVQMLLNTMSRHCKAISGPMVQMSAQPNVLQCLKKRQAMLKRVYLKYCGEDTSSSAAEKNSTMNLKELFQLMKDCGQMDAKFSVSKLATAFIAANSSGPDNGDDGTWSEWDWELSYDEFQEVIVRIVDMKTKTAEGNLADKLENFIVNVIHENT
eukprot:Tamp_15562.p1 GENE.Tamp_15562~~Tamp_15562.p1  ORF type:complete len:374 (-),score=95.04 Tamp_15562:287-1408(-)